MSQVGQLDACHLILSCLPARVPLNFTSPSAQYINTHHEVASLLCASAALLLHFGGAVPVVDDPRHLVSTTVSTVTASKSSSASAMPKTRAAATASGPPSGPIVAQGGPIVYKASSPGPSCPQPVGEWVPPITLGNITEAPEGCLRLNVARPKDTRPDARLP